MKFWNVFLNAEKDECLDNTVSLAASQCIINYCHPYVVDFSWLRSTSAWATRHSTCSSKPPSPSRCWSSWSSWCFWSGWWLSWLQSRWFMLNVDDYHQQKDYCFHTTDLICFTTFRRSKTILTGGGTMISSPSKTLNWSLSRKSLKSNIIFLQGGDTRNNDRSGFQGIFGRWHFSLIRLTRSWLSSS